MYWSRQVRDAVLQALDQRTAQSDALTLALLEQRKGERLDADSLSERITKARIESDRMQTSTAWRMVEFLRRLRTLAAPPGSLRDKLWSRLSGRSEHLSEDRIPHHVKSSSATPFWKRDRSGSS